MRISRGTPTTHALGTGISLKQFRKLAQKPEGVYQYNLDIIHSALQATGVVFHEQDRVLDVACGQRQYMVDHVWRTASLRVGLDFYMEWLTKNRDVDVAVCGDMHRMPFLDNSFDVIVSVDTIEHTPDPEAFFQEVRRILRPKGKIIIFTPHLFGYKSLIAKFGNDVIFKLIHQLTYQQNLHYGVSYRANSLGAYRRVARKTNLAVQDVYYISDISHFFYRSQLLSIAAFLYNDLVIRIGMPWLLNYMIVVLNKL